MASTRGVPIRGILSSHPKHDCPRRWPSANAGSTACARHPIRLSELLHKPLILHCVHAIDDVLRMQMEEQATQPWIFHAFRGKPQQLRQILRRGMYVSFGFRHNSESLIACPAERLLLETDDNPRPVSQLYQEVARLRHMDIDDLEQTMLHNFQAIFDPH